jgi:hypothetical protein
MYGSRVAFVNYHAGNFVYTKSLGRRQYVKTGTTPGMDYAYR